ncbi:MAG: caspase family protein [Bacteroidota bacterium]
MPSKARKKLINFKHSYALIIAVEGYPHIHAPLSTPKRDAEELEKVLIEFQGFKQKEIKRLTNPTKAEILVAIEELKATILAQQPATPLEDQVLKVEEQSCLLVYFAGHGKGGEPSEGGPVGYLLPNDAQLRNVPLRENETLLPMGELYRQLSDIPVHHLLLILDCCFAGNFNRVKTTRGDFTIGLSPMTEIRFETYKSKAAWQVMVSASASEEAADFISTRPEHAKLDDQWVGRKHSPYAQALLEALGGDVNVDVKPPGKQLGDGIMTCDELNFFLKSRVSEISKSSSQHEVQTPDIFRMPQHEGGEFIFSDPRHPFNQDNWAEIKNQNPYKGLNQYDVADAGFYFGRASDLEKIKEKMQPDEHELNPPLLLLTGASGTGKSSLIKAGYLPFLLDEGYQLYQVRPGDDPWSLWRYEPKEQTWEHTKHSFDQLDPAQKQVLFVDQFEERFTACTPVRGALLEGELERLLKGATRANGPFKLILSMRSDFDWQWQLSELGKQLMANDGKYADYVRVHRIVELGLNDLRDALQKPAHLLAYEFEEGLVDMILQELDYLPHALSILSLTMEDLVDLAWETKVVKGNKRTLPTDIYLHKLKGVRGALSRRMESLYQQLSPDKEGEAATPEGEAPPLTDKQKLFQYIFFRLTNLAGGQYARRRVYRTPGQDELDFGAAQQEMVEEILDLLEKGQMLSRGGTKEMSLEGAEERELVPPYVELIHDSLINAWPTGKQWIQDFGKDTLLLQEQLRTAVEEHLNFSPEDASFNGIKPPNWAGQAKLLQVQHSVLDPQDAWLCRDKEESVDSSSLDFLLWEEDPIDEQLETLKQWPKFADCAGPKEIRAAIKQVMRPWLNGMEKAFLKESFQDQKTELQKAIDAKNAALKDKRLAEERQRELAEMTRQQKLQTLAFKKKYQERAMRDLFLIQNGIKPNLHLLLVAIDDYPGENFDLGGCVIDVEAIHQAFATQGEVLLREAGEPVPETGVEPDRAGLFNQIHLHKLINDQATPDKIVERLNIIQEEAGIFDFVLVHVTGHATQEGEALRPREDKPKEKRARTVFCAYPKDPESTGQGGLAYDPMTDLSICQPLMKIDAKVVLLVDFCYSAGFLQPIVEANSSGEVDTYIHSVFALSASGPDQVAKETHAGGVFSQAIRKAFATDAADKDQNGVVYLDELYQYVTQEVRKNAVDQDVFAVMPGAMTNIPLFQRGKEFAFPKKQLMLSGHITEEEVINSVLEMMLDDTNREAFENILSEEFSIGTR